MIEEMEEAPQAPSNQQFSMSNDISKLTESLSKAQSEFPVIERSELVDFTHNGKRTNYSYADLATFVSAIKKPLADNKLSILHDCRTTPGGCSASTLLIHASGQWIKSAPITIRPSDAKPQTIGSALTYARRYSLTSFLGLASQEEDDDAAKAGNREPKADLKFGDSPDHMVLATKLFNEAGFHKDERLKLYEWMVAKGHASDEVSLKRTIQAAAEKIKAKKDAANADAQN